MHLVASPQSAKGQKADQEGAHLHQSAGEVVILSAADSDLALAATRAGEPAERFFCACVSPILMPCKTRTP